MKLNRPLTFLNKQSYLWLVLICSFSFARCSSDGQGEDVEEPVNAADGLNNASLNSSSNTSAAKANVGASMNNATASTGNNFSGANGGNEAASENMLANNSSGNILTNNVAGNPLTNPMANPLANPATNTPVNTAAIPLNQTSNSLLPDNTAGLDAAAPPSNSANIAAPTTPPATEHAEKDTFSWDKMNASPFANPQSNWKAKGKVKYITRRVTKHASPDGPVVGEYNVGNHPLVYQNGNWAELSNGTYIKGNSTTDRPVGYEQKQLLSH